MIKVRYQAMKWAVVRDDSEEAQPPHDLNRGGPYKICGERWLEDGEKTYGIFDSNQEALEEARRLNKIAEAMES